MQTAKQRATRKFRLRLAFTAILIVFIDFVLAIRLYLDGYPSRMFWENGGFIVRQLPFTEIDWLISFAIVLFHVVLFFLLWRSWTPRISK